MEQRELLSSSRLKSSVFKGEPLNPELKHGPFKERSCNDTFTILLYGLFFVGLIYYGSIAYEKGNPLRIVSPFDSDGNQCGFKNGSFNAADYPYVYFQTQNSDFNNFVCVKSCPQNKNEGKIDCLVNSKISKCSELSFYETKLINNLCVPLENEKYKQIEKFLTSSFIEKSITDVYNIRYVILIVIIASFVASILYLFILRISAGFVTWLMILGIFFGSLILGILCIYQAQQSQKDTSNMPEMLQNDRNLLIMGLLLILTSIIIIFTSIVLFTKIKLSIAVTKAAAVFTKEECSSLLIPLLTFLSVVVFIAGGIILSLFIMTSSDLRHNKLSPFGQIKWTDDMRNQVLFVLFGTVWNYEICLGVCYFIIASSASIWYFSHNPQNQTMLSHPVSTSIYRTFRYHIGSIMLGSFILAFFETIQIIFNSIYTNLKKSMVGSEDNTLAQCFFKCSNWCFACFDRFLRFISYNAYITMAMTGDNFCNSAKQGFQIFSKNLKQFSLSQGVGLGFSLIGRFSIGFTGAMVGYLIINNEEFNQHIYNINIPVMIFFLISFLVGSVFMTIFGIASDAIMMCILIDKETNNGQAKSVPYHLQIFEQEYM